VNVDRMRKANQKRLDYGAASMPKWMAKWMEAITQIGGVKVSLHTGPIWRETSGVGPQYPNASRSWSSMSGHPHPITPGTATNAATSDSEPQKNGHMEPEGDTCPVRSPRHPDWPCIREAGHEASHNWLHVNDHKEER
jgi:hypothetical protein